MDILIIFRIFNVRVNFKEKKILLYKLIFLLFHKISNFLKNAQSYVFRVKIKLNAISVLIKLWSM
jgi:hypothetical protein